MTAYASPTDLTNVGCPAAALTTLTNSQILAALESASEFADTFFRARWGSNAVPLLAWDSAVTEAVAKIATLRLLRIRGYSASSTADQRFQLNHDEAVDWLNKVQRQQAHPLVTLAANTTPMLQPKLISSSVVNVATGRTSGNRGW